MSACVLNTKYFATMMTGRTFPHLIRTMTDLLIDQTWEKEASIIHFSWLKHSHGASCSDRDCIFYFDTTTYRVQLQLLVAYLAKNSRVDRLDYPWKQPNYYCSHVTIATLCWFDSPDFLEQKHWREKKWSDFHNIEDLQYPRSQQWTKKDLWVLLICSDVNWSLFMEVMVVIVLIDGGAGYLGIWWLRASIIMIMIAAMLEARGRMSAGVFTDCELNFEILRGCVVLSNKENSVARFSEFWKIWNCCPLEFWSFENYFTTTSIIYALYYYIYYTITYL